MSSVPLPRVALVLLALFIALPPAAPVQAQDAATTRDAAKRPLQIADYARWRSIDGEALSPDGRWVAWSYGRERGDDTLHVRAVAEDGVHTVPFATRPTFSDDGRWVAYRLGVSFAEAAAGEGDAPRRAGLLELATGETWTWESVEAFGFSPTGSHFWVKKEAADDDAEHEGTDLLLRDLSDGSVQLVGSAAEAAFDDAGRWLAWSVDAAGRAGNGIYLLDLETGVRRTLDHGETHYRRLVWHDELPVLAVLRGDKVDGRVEGEYTLVAATRLDERTPRVTELHGHLSPDDTSATPPPHDLADGWVVSDKRAPSFSDDGAVVFVGTRPQAEEPEEWPDSALPLADVNIWHWADDRIQSQQQRAAQRDRNRTWVAAAWLGRDGAHRNGRGEARLVPLEEGRLRILETSDDGRVAIARDDSAWISDWKPDYADWYAVDTRTGARTPVIEGLEYGLGLSPDGAHWLYWRDGQVHAYDVQSDRHRTLTDDAPVSFVDAEWDYPGTPPPYGVAGFTGDGEGVILNGHHDLWYQPLDGGAATNLTEGWGAERDVRLRLARLDPDAEGIDLDGELMATAFGLRTKQSGFVRIAGAQDGRGGIEVLTLDDARWGFPRKADDAERILITRQSWTEFPDLHVVGTDFGERTRITEANPWREEFLWGRRILFDYTLSDGTELQGTLAIPETYREGERLPMVVRFYEKYSDQLHSHPTPVYRHQPNFAGYVSRGYLLMQPDVHFRTRTTHSDMLEAVEAATQKVIDLGYADPERIGLSGHSFSGGGGAFIATRSDMFAAVAHGAAPINLVSEFNQLFVGSGANNHGYDIYGQGRYGTNPYDDFDLYWEQSPISGVEEMDTPVLYLHGEEDSIVNWEQGLEWYNALRFLGKPIIWLSYPGEDHGLRKLENRIDFQLRLQDFFDHHLKGEPAPAWMQDGVPHLEKAEHLREFAPGGIPFGGREPGERGNDTGGGREAGTGSSGWKPPLR
jgi:dipeptidyl aminopeptidase/acylaminoacyl peptidase